MEASMRRYLLAAIFSVVFVTPAFADFCIAMDMVNHSSPCEVFPAEYCQEPYSNYPYPNYKVMGRYDSRVEAEDALLSMTMCKRAGNPQYEEISWTTGRITTASPSWASRGEKGREHFAVPPLLCFPGESHRTLLCR
jgi:hypothetical protein